MEKYCIDCKHYNAIMCPNCHKKSKWITNKTTQADLIRKMTDEEIAEIRVITM